MRLERYLLNEYIKQVDGEWCVFSHQTNKNFGCYDTKEEAKERLEQIKRFSEAKVPRPRGGDFFFNDVDNKIQKIHSVSKGYAYIDTGTTRRDVIPSVDLKLKGKHKGKNLWIEEWGQ